MLKKNNFYIQIIYIFIGICIAILLYILCSLIYKIYTIEKFTEDYIEIEREQIDVYVINLAKNKDRLDLITHLYNKSDLKNIPFIRIDAINGKEIDVEPYVTPRVYSGIVDIENNNGQRYHHSQITRGAVGCYLSHLKIYEQIQQSYDSKPYALILEDDAWFNENIYKSGIRYLYKNIPQDWDIVLLGKIDRDIIPHENYLEMREFWGTHGYIITKNGVHKMLQNANIPINDQIDAVMGKLSRENIIKIYGTKQQYISANNSFGSEIQMPITQKEGINPDNDHHHK